MSGNLHYDYWHVAIGQLAPNEKVHFGDADEGIARDELRRYDEGCSVKRLATVESPVSIDSPNFDLGRCVESYRWCIVMTT